MQEEIILSGPPEVSIEDPRQSLGEFYLERLSTHGNKIAQVDAVTGKTCTYDEIHRLTLRLAEALRYGKAETNNLHLATGDSVGICSENSIDFCIPVIAALYLGSSVAPLNPSYVGRELEHALKISKPKIIFASKSKLNDVLELAKASGFVKLIVVMDEIRSDLAGKQGSEVAPSSGFVKSINDLLNAENEFVPSLPMEKDLPKLDPAEHVAFILCSSGTTGLPKGVMLTHKNIRIAVAHFDFFDYGGFIVVLRNLRFLGAHENKVCLGLLPFFHGYGLVTLLRMAAIGVKMVVMQRFEGDFFLRTIEKHRVTTLILVPPLLVFISKDPRVDKYDLSSITDLRSAAAPLRKEVQDKVESIINRHRARVGAPPIMVRQGYGLTETTLGVIISPSDVKKAGSVGALAPGVQCKVVDLETGKSLGPYKEGELWFRGALMMKGYKDNPEATAAVLDSDGWIHSGDVGYYDEDKHFFVVDRIKELIKYKGYQVAPAELEALLLTHPEIEDAAVIGIPDESAGEVPQAFVVKRGWSKLSEADVIKFVEKNVSNPKRLRGGVTFVKSIPKTSSGKILRRELKAFVKSKM